MNQKTVTILISVAATGGYVWCTLARGKKVRSDDVLLFGLSIGGAITAAYIVIESFSQGSTESGLYIALWGLVLIGVSVQKALVMLRAVLRTKTGAES